ncbi:MAG TPA: M48 family metallopeptidase [Acidobacteriaceae bacterium]|nr:M48 family metallopeptidase [Acidobacteriaceae bacterium]
MRVPMLLAFAGLSATLVFAQQPTPATPTGANTPSVTEIPRAQTPATQSPTSTSTTDPSSTTSATPAQTQQTPAATAGTTAPAQASTKDQTADSKDQTADNGKAAKPGKKGKVKADQVPEDAKADSIPNPGEELDPHIKKGSEEDVNAVGQRNIGGRGLGNWYSTNWEIGTGKQYSMEIEKSSHLVTDPVVVEYINRIGQNIVKNSDAKVPFTIKVLDTDEINAMALPGGFFYVNSGLILACDSEDELAGVMAHEISHVAAHHAAREMTKLNYMQLGQIPLIIFTQGTWTGYGIYEASQLAIPLTFLQFSREYEAEADYLGIQYMYKAGYDPQGMVSIFEKLAALEKHKPGALSKAFSDHPATPDRIAAVENEIATILPAEPQYMVTSSEFDQVKARLARIQNKRGLNDKKDNSKPTLRRVGGSNNDPNAPNNPSSSTDDRPTLGRRD